MCLQETYLEKPGLLQYLWRGNFFLTEGDGRSCGCITLLSSHINIIASTNFDNRAHDLVCQRASDTSASFIVANLYAPNQHLRSKTEFFARILDKIYEYEESFGCGNVLVAGDFNLTFNAHESKNRAFTIAEKRVATTVKDLKKGGNLIDIWDNEKSFTWRRANSDIYSCIDRIWYRSDEVKVSNLKTNLALSYSDHCAVTAELSFVNKPMRNKSRITRLDPTLLNNEDTRIAIIDELETLMNMASNDWHPHLKLEYAKMCIRSIAEKHQALRKTSEKNEEDILNEELDTAIKALSANDMPESRRLALMGHIEELERQS